MGSGTKKGPMQGNPLEQMRKQSGSGLLMTRALGLAGNSAPGALPRPQGGLGPKAPKAPVKGPNRNQGSPYQANPMYKNAPPTAPQNVGSQQVGNFYADRPSQRPDGTHYVGGGAWHSARPGRQDPIQGFGYGEINPARKGQVEGDSGYNEIAPAGYGSQPVSDDGMLPELAPVGRGSQQQGVTATQGQALQSAAGRSPTGSSFNIRQAMRAGNSAQNFTPMRGQGNGMGGQGGAPANYSQGGATAQQSRVIPPSGGGQPPPAPGGISQATQGLTSSQSQGYTTAPQDAKPEDYDENGNYNPWGYSADELDQYNRRHETLTEGGNTVDPATGDIYDQAGEKIGNINDASPAGGSLFETATAGGDTGQDSALGIVYNGGNHGATGANLHPNRSPQAPTAGPAANPGFDALSAYMQQPIPQMDQSALSATDAASEAQYARQRARAIRGMAEAGAYAGAGAEQMAGQQGEVGVQYNLAAGAEKARNHLQANIQNFQAQMDHYNKGFQIAMAQFQATQHAQDFQNALKYLEESQKAAKQMAAYQKKLGSPGAHDVAGVALGTGLNAFTYGLGGQLTDGLEDYSDNQQGSGGPYGT